MPKIFKSRWILCCCLECCFNLVLAPSSWAADLLPNLAQLQRAAESFIFNLPQESAESVIGVIRNYQQIQNRWMGPENIKFNRNTLNSSPLFAKTELFESTLAELDSVESIKFIRLRYTTSLNHKPEKVSGLLLLPPANQKVKGIVLYFHSTITGKLNVPSLKFQDYKAQMLAAVFAAHGYIVAAPDYIGLGDNYQRTHPYILYPGANVNDGKDMLLAVTSYLHHQQAHLLPPRIALFSSGYSEGGSYALWFSRIYQSNSDFSRQLQSQGMYLTKTVPIEGAYNLTGVMFPFLLTSQVNDHGNKYNISTSFWGTLLKPSLLANVMLAYADYARVPIQGLLNPQFFDLQCTFLPQISCNDNSKIKYNLDSYALTTKKTFYIAFKYFLAATFKSASGIIYSPLFNSVVPLMAPGVATNSQLLQTAVKANILAWPSHNPVTLVSLRSDSLVPEQNAADAYAGMLKAGSTQLKYIKIPNALLHARGIFGVTNIDHVGFELYALLIALNEFNN